MCGFSERYLHFLILCLQTKQLIFEIVKDDFLTAKPRSPWLLKKSIENYLSIKFKQNPVKKCKQRDDFLHVSFYL